MRKSPKKSINNFLKLWRKKRKKMRKNKLKEDKTLTIQSLAKERKRKKWKRNLQRKKKI